jgi:hypothetical protein
VTPPAPDRPLVHYRTMIADSSRWLDFERRAGDIVVATPPKCGTTWTQMICSLLVHQTPELPAPLGELSPWLDMLTRSPQETYTILGAQQHRRCIKTHTPFDGLPYDERVTYLCVGRDPRDVALSMANHRANFDFTAMISAREAAVGLDDIADQLEEPLPEQPPTVIDQIWTWVDLVPESGSSGSSLRALAHHIETFWAVRDLPNVHFVHYDDLRTDLAGQMRRLADLLGITVDASRWPALVEAATFESMRAAADRVAPDVGHALWHSNADFFRTGTSGQWHAVLDDEGRRRYEATARAIMAPDVYDWLHRD